MIAQGCPEVPLTKASTKVAISGAGNVAQYTALKVIELGATVLSLSDSKGSLIATEAAGYSKEVVDKVAALKLKGGFLESLKDEPGYKYYPGQRPWTLIPQIDIALPGATQNEVSGEEADALIKAGVRVVAEGSNMGCTQEAIEKFEATRVKGGKAVWYAPGSKFCASVRLPFLELMLVLIITEAANCGGVAVSGLEMAQNSQRLTWTTEEVDAKLKNIMQVCFEVSISTFIMYIVHLVTFLHIDLLLCGQQVVQ